MVEANEGGVNPELAELVGKNVIIKETDRTRSLGIAGGPGFVESTMGDKLRVLYTDKTFGPSGPYDLEKEEVEIAK